MTGFNMPEHPELLSQEEMEALLQDLREFIQLAIDAICEAANQIMEAFKAILPDVLPILSERYATAAAARPRWYHLSRHARRWRTRKKWHNALWKEALR